MKEHNLLSRRAFIASTATVAAATILPSHVLGAKGQTPPSGQFRFAQIGCWGQGKHDLMGVIKAGGRPVALCDVDAAVFGKALKRYPELDKTLKQYPDTPVFTDYRKMLDKIGRDIDGVVVSTPDHSHAVEALDAIRRGKHVYVEKPLARTFGECQALLDASHKHGVVTQMGNQGHSGAGLKLWQKMMDAGAFGEIERIDIWSDMPDWPQGMTEPPEPEEIPPSLSWNDWIGPQSMRPYSKFYAPKKWRGWWDFGCGAMGDVGCHNMDPVFWIFKLGLPVSVRAQTSSPAGIAYPEWSIIEFTFAPTSVYSRPLKVTWYDGKKLPPKPEGAHPQLQLGEEGCMITGSKMTAKGASHASAPYPIALGGKPYSQAIKEVESHWRAELKKLEDNDHYGLWVEAAKAGQPSKPGSNFSYSAPMTQAILLGCIALRFPGRDLHWDNDKRQFSNLPEANQWLTFKPREGYSLSL
jgi:predicted dehydrogenase